MQTERCSQAVVQHTQHVPLHAPYVGLCVRLVRDVDEVLHFGSIHLLILTGNQHGSHPHQLQLRLLTGSGLRTTQDIPCSESHDTEQKLSSHTYGTVLQYSTLSTHKHYKHRTCLLSACTYRWSQQKMHLFMFSAYPCTILLYASNASMQARVCQQDATQRH